MVSLVSGMALWRYVLRSWSICQTGSGQRLHIKASPAVLDRICTHRLDGLEKLNTVFLNATVSIGKFDKSFAGCCLWLSHTDNRKDVPEGWKGRLAKQSSKPDMAANKSMEVRDLPLWDWERSKKALSSLLVCSISPTTNNKVLGWSGIACWWIGGNQTVQLCYCKEQHLCRALLFSQAPPVFWPVHLKSGMHPCE